MTSLSDSCDSLYRAHGWCESRYAIFDSLSDHFMIEMLQEWRSLSFDTLTGKMFAAYLASAAADCFVGQIFPVCGGWVPR